VLHGDVSGLAVTAGNWTSKSRKFPVGFTGLASSSLTVASPALGVGSPALLLHGLGSVRGDAEREVEGVEEGEAGAAHDDEKSKVCLGLVIVT